MTGENQSSVVCDQVRLEPTCSGTEARKILGILSIATTGVILPRQQITKMLIILCRCTGWSVSWLFAYAINRLWDDVTHKISDKIRKSETTCTENHFCRFENRMSKAAGTFLLYVSIYKVLKYIIQVFLFRPKKTCFSANMPKKIRVGRSENLFTFCLIFFVRKRSKMFIGPKYHQQYLKTYI